VREAVLRQKQHGKLIKDIHAMMEQNGLTVEDLQAAMENGGKRGPGRPPKSATNGVGPVKGTRAVKVAKAAKAATSKSRLPAKYRNPKTGEEWSGWARPPLWIKDVKDRSKFLINPDTETSIVLGPRKNASAKKAAVSGKKSGARRGRPPSKAV
jgi:DNA-binding protein H-NS